MDCDGSGREFALDKAEMGFTFLVRARGNPQRVSERLGVVLQKLEEKKWGVEWSSQACLDGYAEQLGNQRDLPSYISFCHSSQLPFSHHVHHLKPRYRFAMPSQRRKSPFLALSSV